MPSKIEYNPVFGILYPKFWTHTPLPPKVTETTVSWAGLDMDISAVLLSISIPNRGHAEIQNIKCIGTNLG